MKRSVLVVLICLLLSLAWAEDVAWKSKRGLFVMTYDSELEPLTINQLHSWVLHIKDTNGEPVTDARIVADGGMPTHDHGLPTRPRVTAELGDGAYRLDGLRFHMRGDWEVTLTIDANGVSDTVTVYLTL